MSESPATPLVSVVMATYAGDRLDFLREAVASILNQTYEHVEFIIVENGPLPEEHARFLHQAAQVDPRVRLISLEENQGPAGARNVGFKAAEGAYIAVMDADDVALPGRIARQAAELDTGRADVVGSCYLCIDDVGRPLREKRMPLSPEAVRRAALLINPIANPTAMARAELLQRHGYREDFPYGEDYWLWVTLLREGCTLVNLPECLLHFRTGSGFARRRRGWLTVRTDLANKLHALPLYPPTLRPLLLIATPFLALARLLPAPLLGLVYRVRHALRF